MIMYGTTIFHVSFGEESNYYFGSISAIYDMFTPEQMGVSQSRLYSYGITEEKPYRNKKCVIRRGLIHRKKSNRNSS